MSAFRRHVLEDPGMQRIAQWSRIGRWPCPVCKTVHPTAEPCPRCGPFETLGDLDEALRNGPPAADEVGIFDDVDTEEDLWAPTPNTTGI